MTIEVKGCWNPDVFTAMEAQLRDRYMAVTSETVGLFLVGWYVCDAWKKSSVAGRIERRAEALNEMKAKLTQQAKALSSAVQTVGFFILDATLS
jgi:hypothetical protein